MKRTKFLSTIALTTASVICLVPVAHAEELTDSKQESAIEAPAVEESATGTDTKTAVSESQDNEKEESVETSQIILIDSQETKTIAINDESKSLSQLADEYGFKLENFKQTDGTTPKPEYKLAESEQFILFKSETSATSETVELPIPTLEEETDELFEGETEVKSKGTVGKALKTTITVKELSADKKFNKETAKVQAPVVKERLTVLTAPTPKIVLVGTKEKPAPVVEDVPESSNESPDRDPISGEPLNNSDTTSTTYSAPVSSSGMSGYSSANGASVPASTVSPSTITNSNSSRGAKAVELAYTRLGADYHWGASRDDAFDCSGLIYWIYKTHLGVDIPRTAKQQGSSAQQVPLSQLQPGDLLWTNSHIGLYVGDGKMIHASRSNDEIVVSGIGWFVDDGAKGARIR